MRITRKQVGIYVGALVVVVGCAVLVVQNLGGERQPSTIVDASFRLAHLNGVPITLEVVETPEARQRGLSGRTTLPGGEGMLFIFPTDERHGFWMPDMHFSIDIIWFNTEMRAVHIAEQVSPESYPTIYTPDEPARYVLEVPAGWVAEHGIAEGDTLVLDR